MSNIPFWTRCSLAVCASFLVILLAVRPALAHEGREVGSYHLVVGWHIAPTFVEQPNALYLRVTTSGDDHSEADSDSEAESEAHEEEEQPVTGLEETLRAEVIFGDRTMSLTLEPLFGEPGAYVANMIPTVEGSYIFNITGEIEGTPVDEQFNTADGDIADVESSESLQFPDKVPPTGTLQAELARAQQDIGNARLMALVGIAAGFLGLTAAGVALLRRPRG